MADSIEPLGVSGILPSTGFDATASDYYSSEQESSISEYDQEATSMEPAGNSSRLRKPHKSIHIKKTQEPIVEPTVIPTTYASFRLSNAKVSFVVLFRCLKVPVINKSTHDKSGLTESGVYTLYCNYHGQSYSLKQGIL